MDLRLRQLQQWCCDILPCASQHPDQLTINIVAGDASFRRYFRVTHPELGPALIAMDAPPEKEDIEPFVQIATRWRSHDIPVPEIIHKNDGAGFLLLQDFGDEQLLSTVQANAGQAQSTWYEKAIHHLHHIQTLEIEADLPPYDNALLERELALFTEWLLGKALGLELSNDEQHIIAEAKRTLIHSALEQPCVVVHRDYHSRNIMVLEDNSLGIIDFQDAVAGPVTYDLVSLLRDCYIRLDPPLVHRLVNTFKQHSPSFEVRQMPAATFSRFFDLMGIQRHMKASGIFARLALRDNKWDYIQDIPLTLEYIRTACAAHDDFRAFGNLLAEKIQPRLLAYAAQQVSAQS